MIFKMIQQLQKELSVEFYFKVVEILHSCLGRS